MIGEPLVPSAFPFDNLILPPAALLGLLSMEDQQFPASPGELEPHTRLWRNAVWWPQKGFYFWHQFTTDGRLDIAGKFRDAQFKFTHMFNKFARLGALRRRVFVLANTQDNLAWITRHAPVPLDFSFSAERIDAVRLALDRIFPANGNELLVVSCRSRIADDPDIWASPPRLLPPGDKNWLGDKAAWAQVFADHFGTSQGRTSVAIQPQRTVAPSPST